MALLESLTDAQPKRVRGSHGNLVQILGPLRMGDDRAEVVLGGLNRRAVVGYLLLHPNQVVSTRKLMTALWGSGRPASARKILHNAVCGLRKSLLVAAEERSFSAVSLVTHEPGYQLNVDERQIDFGQFKSLVERSRIMQADNCFDEAATLLREALGLWRGPVLADLAEAGFRWPELAAVENARLDALEDYSAAELACGRHESVLAELRTMTLMQPLRERLLGNFMLALYRCGRQGEALSMYERAEATSKQAFGIEPVRELRELYRLIRADEPSLLFGRPVAGEGLSYDAAGIAGADARAGQPIEPDPGDRTVAERRRVSLLQVRADLGNGPAGVDPEQLDDTLARLDAVIRPQAERFGGVVSMRLGSHWLIVFGAPHSHHDDAKRAVLCALAIRSLLGEVMAEADGDRSRMVVATGLVLARFRSGTDSPPTVTGPALDACYSLLPFVPGNEIWVNGETWMAAGITLAFERVRMPSVVWAAVGVQQPPQTGSVPMIGRELARKALLGALDRFVLNRVPEIVTVHGEPGIGKSRLIAEIEGMVVGRSVGHLPVPVVHLPVVLDDTALASALCTCCAITGDDLPDAANRKLHDFVRRTAETPAEAEWIISLLQPLLHCAVHSDESARRADWMAAWWLLLERVAAVRCLVLIVDDVEFADHRVLDFVERITRPPSEASVFVVAKVRPTAAQRRPQWAETQRRATPVTLLPLPDSEMGFLINHLFDACGLELRQTGPTQQEAGLPWLSQALVRACQGNPAFAHDYVSLIREGLSPGGPTLKRTAEVLPPLVERMTAERLDRLPVMTRTVLQDAVMAGPVVWGDAVVAAGDGDRDAVKQCLDELVRRGFLVRVETDPASGDVLYEFPFPPDRHVVWSRLSLALRADKRAKVMAWLGELSDRRLAVLLDHYRREEHRMTEMAGCSLGELLGDVVPDVRRGQADEAVWYYLALTKMSAWFRATARWVAGGLEVPGDAVT